MKKGMKFISVFLAVVITVLSAATLSASAGTSAGKSISYSFANTKAGYAEGKITFSSDSSGDYKLYWADDAGKLSGYYSIKKFSFSSSGSKTYSFGDHIAIPNNATRVIALDSSNNTVAEYIIPVKKRLNSFAGNLRYKFNAYSDLHININGYFSKATERLKQGLQFGVEKATDFIVITGDVITHKTDINDEWKSYEKTLSSSNYTNPVWETIGNHDLKEDPKAGIKAFVRNSGTDNTAENYDANKPYYAMTEKNSGDIFIFMALEKDSSPTSCDEFSSAQMSWVTNIIKQNYDKGVNIYICEHSPIEGFGAGDDMSDPYYKAHLNQKYESTKQFKQLLIDYPKLIFLSGHTHADFSLNWNYSNENGKACSMIHIPALCGSTMPYSNEHKFNYNNGDGFNTQGYLVEAYDNEIIFYGANIPEKLIYPEYSYIMEGYSSKEDPQPTTEPATTAPVVTTAPVTTEPVVTTSPATTVQPATTAPVTTAPETTNPGYETQRVYFANSLKWKQVYCHSWLKGSDIKSVWPGLKAEKCGISTEGYDLYYADIPAVHTGIVWNNGDNGEQTENLVLEENKNYFVPKEGQSGKKITAKAMEWPYGEESTTAAPTTETTTTFVSTTVAPTTAAPTTAPATTEPVEPEYQLGDVDKDGKIIISDATAVQQYLVELIVFDENDKKRADVDFSGDVNIKDATQIQKYIAEIITKFEPADSGKTDPEPVGATDYKQLLDSFYTFASFDQYQALKKLYKNGGSEAELSAAAEELKKITDHINGTASYSYKDTYYFENNGNWSAVYAYAWNGSSKNGEWPGVKLTNKVGTSNGHDVYKIKFDSAGQYTKLILNAGSNSSQTVDINLSSYGKNAFRLGSKNSEEKYAVSNFTYSE